MELAEAMQREAQAIADPSRFEIFRHITEAAGPVTVAELTDLMGFNHNAVRQHLAVLVDAGLVAVSEEERSTRGRPRKLYRTRADALAAFGSVSGSYERLAALLLELATSDATPYEVGRRASLEAGGTTERVSDLVVQLARDGFEPSVHDDGSIELGRCPFADVAARDQSVICELHRGLIDGRLERMPGAPTCALTVEEPAQAGCVVAIRPKNAA